MKIRLAFLSGRREFENDSVANLLDKITHTTSENQCFYLSDVVFYDGKYYQCVMRMHTSEGYAMILIPAV